MLDRRVALLFGWAEQGQTAHSVVRAIREPERGASCHAEKNRNARAILIVNGEYFLGNVLP